MTTLICNDSYHFKGKEKSHILNYTILMNSFKNKSLIGERRLWRQESELCKLKLYFLELWKTSNLKQKAISSLNNNKQNDSGSTEYYDLQFYLVGGRVCSSFTIKKFQTKNLRLFKNMTIKIWIYQLQYTCLISCMLLWFPL